MRFRVLFIAFFFTAISLMTGPTVWADESWTAEVLPSEQYITKDENSGAELIFVSRSEATERNFYFHQRSWLPEESLFFFLSDRTGRMEVFGYLQESGELVRLERKDAEPVDQTMTAGRFDDCLFMTRGKEVLEWTFTIETRSSEQGKSSVKISERVIGTLPDDFVRILGLNESAHGQGMVIGFSSSGPHKCRVIWMDKRTGAIKEIAATDFDISHVQSSWNTPGLVSFARHYEDSIQGDRVGEAAKDNVRARIWLADLTDRKPWPIYTQQPGELVTHECWWADDQMTFCSGEHYQDGAEDAHVKVYDLKSGITRIVGPGAWWPGCTKEETARLNWWHASGSPNGRLVAGDNWHGGIAIFSGKSARARMLTVNHRTYGGGAHPHVGWSPTSTKVVFASNRFGNPDMCIAVIPVDWRQGW